MTDEQADRIIDANNAVVEEQYAKRTERRLPPALEFDVKNGEGLCALDEVLVLDWLCGKDGEPDLVERAEMRAWGGPNRLGTAGAFIVALRAELGEEA